MMLEQKEWTIDTDLTVRMKKIKININTIFTWQRKGSQSSNEGFLECVRSKKTRDQEPAAKAAVDIHKNVK